MNNKGKSSIVFLALIPLFFVISIIILDTLFSYVENNKFKKVTENVISEVINNDELDKEDYYMEIKKTYENRGYETEMLVVEVDNNNIYVENEHTYFGFFSSFSNIKGDEIEKNILGITFKVKKNSVSRIKINTYISHDGKIEFEYTK